MSEQLQLEGHNPNIVLFYNLFVEYRQYLVHLNPVIFTDHLYRIQDLEQFLTFFSDINSRKELLNIFYQYVETRDLDNQFSSLLVEFLNLLSNIIPLVRNKSGRDNQ